MKLLLTLLCLSEIATAATHYKLSRPTPITKELGYDFSNRVCNVASKGIRVEKILTKNVIWVKVRLLEGECKGKVGWTDTKSIELAKN